MLQYRDELAQRLSLPSGKTFPDPNNNGNCLKTIGVKTKAVRGDKYSLRPRSLRHISRLTSDIIAQSVKTNETNNNDPPAPVPVQTKPPKQPKPKQKPAPLSKYRRKTANARERSRMREINTAFESLRRAVPHMFVSQCPGALNQTPSEKLTKITTLRLAMRYISALSSALNSPMQAGLLSSCSSASSTCSSVAPSQEFSLDLDSLLMESSDGESLCTLSDNSFPLSDQPLTPVTFDENPLADATYFGDQSLGLDFNDHSLSPDFSEHSLSPFDQFLPHFS